MRPRLYVRFTAKQGENGVMQNLVRNVVSSSGVHIMLPRAGWRVVGGC